MADLLKNKKFIIAEILALASFVLNTSCVFTAKQLHGPGGPAWLPDFGFSYYLKTILAIFGIGFFYYSKILEGKDSSRLVSVFTLLTLLYSLPILNFLLYFPIALIFSLKVGALTYEARIPTQVLWALPSIVIFFDILVKFIRKRKYGNK